MTPEEAIRRITEHNRIHQLRERNAPFYTSLKNYIEEHGEQAAAIMLHYGAKHQLLKLAEECAELTQQCMKCFDLDLQYSEDFVEELADVRIMIMQFESILSGSWGELYQKIIAEKLERQMKRINDE